MLAVELADEAGRLAAVQSALSAALVAGGFYEPEARPFLAHVTVARVGRDARFRARSSPRRSRALHRRTVTLFRSRLGQGPARYEALASVTLSG